ncbi:hypothetical protein [Cupriavidus taiwanensis]|uniref:hypothetical protein n=1 Tax=Cupriavidus taiwanensis TaxID=164546 RepID=UPI001F11F078|nr:hypothetical protein [Cupriavidus taiwanensis]
MTLPLDFLLWLRENHSVINEYREYWFSTWTSRKRSYTAAEFEKIVTDAYDIERKNDFDGHYTIESYIDFYKSCRSDSSETMNSCNEYVEKNRVSYFMSLLVTAYHFLGNKKVTFSSLCGVGKKTRKRRSSQWLEACWNGSLLRQRNFAKGS